MNEKTEQPHRSPKDNLKRIGSFLEDKVFTLIENVEADKGLLGRAIRTYDTNAERLVVEQPNHKTEFTVKIQEPRVDRGSRIANLLDTLLTGQLVNLDAPEKDKPEKQKKGPTRRTFLKALSAVGAGIATGKSLEPSIAQAAPANLESNVENEVELRNSTTAMIERINQLSQRDVVNFPLLKKMPQRAVYESFYKKSGVINTFDSLRCGLQLFLDPRPLQTLLSKRVLSAEDAIEITNTLDFFQYVCISIEALDQIMFNQKGFDAINQTTILQIKHILDSIQINFELTEDGFRVTNKFYDGAVQELIRDVIGGMFDSNDALESILQERQQLLSVVKQYTDAKILPSTEENMTCSPYS